MTQFSMLNGRVCSGLPAADRGLAFGHGLFETIRVTAGQAPLWPQHRERLLLGAKRLYIPCDADEIQAEFRLFLEQMGKAESTGIVKFILTAGASGRGYGLPTECMPNRLWQWFELPNYPAASFTQGIEARICRHPLPLAPRLTGIKHLNRLDQVLAQAELDLNDSAATEGLLADPDGNLIEAISKNIFCCSAGQWITPDLSRCGIAGVMREILLNKILPGLNIDCAVAKLPLGDLHRVDEMFLCNSVIGIWPVAKLESARLSVGETIRRIQRELAVQYGYPWISD